MHVLCKASLGVTCTFNDRKLCELWHQDGDDSFDWTFYSGATVTEDTGPLSGRGGGMDVSNKPKKNPLGIICIFCNYLPKS